MKLKNKPPINIMKLNLAGLFVALGIIIPFFAGHALGIPGTILLPMHIPVLMGGLLLGWKYGLIVGILAPILSSLLTGMPVMWPVLPMMIGELGVYGFLSGFLRKKTGLALYPALIIAMIAGRIVNGIVAVFVLSLPNLAAMITLITGIVTSGLPGIVIQLAFVPLLVKLVEKACGRFFVEKEIYRNSSVNWESHPEMVKVAYALIKSSVFGCVLIKNGVIIHKGEGKGLRPLLELMETKEGREKLEGAIVVDKIIGKAAAMLLVLGKAKAGYGLTVSKSGDAYLRAHRVETGHIRWVDIISDRTGQGICPMERSVMDIDDPREGYEKILAQVLAMRAKISETA